MNKISVIGAGTWGTTVAKILSEKGFNVVIWAREAEVINSINLKHENEIFLKGIKLPKKLKAVHNISDAISESKLLINAVPTQYIRTTLTSYGIAFKGNIILSLSKGIELKTFERPSEILYQIFKKPTYVLSGPNFAIEIANKMPAATTIAGPDRAERKKLQKILNCKYFRVYENDDIVGTELSGALKNVIAIAAGMCDALGLGNNTKAALITRGLNEIRKFGKKFGAKDITFLGLSGIGDLLLTCNSKISRNYSVGYNLGKGKKLKEFIQNTTHIAEGIKTSKAVYELSKKIGIEMPITNEVYYVIYHSKKPEDALKSLMSRRLKSEF
ncbi:MAG: NAD(P)-dependent glycerol-3-phosphate dehydrogenase [Elusimicrobiota bacterium]